jgi:hypothetical protein
VTKQQRVRWVALLRGTSFRLIHGGATRVLQTLPDQSIDAVITEPSSELNETKLTARTHRELLAAVPAAEFSP